MITGWLLWNEHWYYLKPDGIMAADEMTRTATRLDLMEPGFSKNEISNKKGAFACYMPGKGSFCVNFALLNTKKNTG